MARIVSVETMRDERRAQLVGQNLKMGIPFVLNGRDYLATKEFVSGEMTVYELARPIGEMLITASGQKEMLEKIVLDVELGREQVPILYTPIYERIENADFPQTFEAKWELYGVIVFLEHVEGEQVKFGSLQAEKGPTAKITTYAAGFQYTEDLVIYNQTFNMEILNRAFGEAYNALLNHLHLYPIISFSYQAANKTAAVFVDEKYQVLPSSVGRHKILSMRATLEDALVTCANAKRQGNILLAASSRKYEIEPALQSVMINNTSYSALGIDTIIYYDGWEVTVGKKTHSYSGVTSSKAYLVRPRRGFKELVKHDLRVDAGNADITRLIEDALVGRARRGVFAAVSNNVQEIALPT